MGRTSPSQGTEEHPGQRDFNLSIFPLGFVRGWNCFLSAPESCPTLQHHRLQPARLLCSWNFPGKNIEGGCHLLLQGNFPTQGLNLPLLYR